MSSSDIQNLSIGSFVDCLDTINKWLPAKIIKISLDNKSYLIHYLYWSERWDSWITKDSVRLAPFKTRSSSSSFDSIILSSNIIDSKLKKIELKNYHDIDDLWLNNMDKYKCSICTCVVFNPLNQTCGHLHCLSCLKQHFSTNGHNCPVCRENLHIKTLEKYNINTFVKHEISQQIVKCPHGCSWSGQIGFDNQNYISHGYSSICHRRYILCEACQQNIHSSAVAAHPKECTSRIITCEHCEKSMKYSEYMSHINQNQQDEESAPCENCECCNHCRLNGVIKYFPLSQIPKHQAECPHRPIQCQLCNCVVSLSGLHSHMFKECASRPTICSECNIIMPLCDLNAHKELHIPSK
jgi:hypothetical protein